ncbi:MAG: cardiolipin synthase [Gallionellales bacterium RIFCSPLOWO2_02_FULL_59_110]|nr:MAG: cardiolipin synthase [Gallionellales bacterium RIFCSPLOWO2_02_FULL_59_110]OGT01656.1 MAG: cardiolipin synthase [Gallionellales bacterium RIFCSPLOWO2_02_58_13]
MNIKKIGYMGIAKLAMTLCLVLLAGCSPIPAMVPDMAMQPSHPVQLDGAHGPLTAKQSKAILARLKRNGADTNIFDKHLALEAEIVGSPLVAGNKVELLVDGPTTYNSMFAAIGNAKDHINMETYIIEDDEIGRRFVELLIRKQRSGVQVNFIYDSVGAISTPKEFFKPLKESGVNVLEFNPVNPLLARKDWQVNRRDHRKLLVVDGQVAFVGGINISSVYSSGSFGRYKPAKGNTPWRDTHLRMAGPVVSEFQKLFMATWNEQKGGPLASGNYFPEPSSKGNEVVRAIGSSPEEPYSQIYATLLSAINSAETQVFLTNAYFVPDPQLLATLKEAAQRGVDVRLLLPEKIDSVLVFYASRSYYDELLSAGVKIYQRQGALLHAKTALIDGVWSTVGSTNLDWRSFLNNQEIDAVILGQNFGAQMQALFEKDLGSSRLVTLEAWRNRSIGARIKERAARLWAHWL